MPLYLDTELQHHPSDHRGSLQHQSHGENSSASCFRFHHSRDSLARLGHSQSQSVHQSKVWHLEVYIEKQSIDDHFYLVLNFIPYSHQRMGSPAVYTPQLHLCCPNHYHRLFPICLQYKLPPCPRVQQNHLSTEWNHLYTHWMLLVVKIGYVNYMNVCMKLSGTYHYISLQHHHHGHSLNYTDLLHHNWGSLTVLILLHYIQYCPKVWVHFPDQSEHSCTQLLLQKKVDQEFISQLCWNV